MKDRNQALTKIFKNNINVNCNFASIPGGSIKVDSGVDPTILKMGAAESLHAYWFFKAFKIYFTTIRIYCFAFRIPVLITPSIRNASTPHNDYALQLYYRIRPN